MTNVERFHKLMAGDASLDASPVIEWAIWWDKTLQGWHEEGLPDVTGRALFDYFGLDHIEQFWFNHYSPECPKPDIMEHLIEDYEDYTRIRPHILPEDAVQQEMDRILKTKPLHACGDTIVWYTVNGFFWFTRELFGDEMNCLSFYECPELRHRICEDLLQWQIKVIDEFSQYIRADFMTIAEDMSYNKGPMISEATFREFIMPYYKRLIPEIKKYGTKVFVDTDGNVDMMLPWLIEAGVDGVLPLERQAGVDLPEYRRKYPDFMFIGGFDKMCLFQGEMAIRAEFERLLPVIRSGRYLIGMDHQTPPGVPMETYRYYLKLLREYSFYACKDCGQRC